MGAGATSDSATNINAALSAGLITQAEIDGHVRNLLRTLFAYGFMDRPAFPNDNRINFAKCSGVIVDVCKGHGTWFDRDELTRIVEFIRGGGLDAARAKERPLLAR